MAPVWARIHSNSISYANSPSVALNSLLLWADAYVNFNFAVVSQCPSKLYMRCTGPNTYLSYVFPQVGKQSPVIKVLPWLIQANHHPNFRVSARFYHFVMGQHLFKLHSCLLAVGQQSSNDYVNNCCCGIFRIQNPNTLRLLIAHHSSMIILFDQHSKKSLCLLM